MLIQKIVDVHLEDKNTVGLSSLNDPNGIEYSPLPVLNGINSEIKRLLNDQDYEFYSFEKSALAIAGSMSKSDHNAFDAIADLLLQKPRKVFIECDWTDRLMLYENTHKSYKPRQ